ncbi:hypothetical protein [Gorillibacterium sp. sgz5001074]|uniref:hypothetical protein n=1 Tax=Gorillibacterium sp. sgz5001074 TaxID=3446695 RepID=UPI003F67E8E6
MPLWLRILLIIVIVFSVTSFVWFLLGSTSYFQRGMDIIGTTLFWGGGIPVLLIGLIFTILLIKGWTPTTGGQYVPVIIGILLSVLLSSALIQSVSTHGWAHEKVESDSIKITIDNMFEYRIDLINLFQKNSRARLYLKEISSGEEKLIPVGIQTSKIAVLGVNKINHWVKLEPTDEPYRYVLSTTDELRIPEEKFEIDFRLGTSSRMN